MLASTRSLALLLAAVLQPTFALELPDTVSCSDGGDFDGCGVNGTTDRTSATRSMEQIPHIKVPVPHWYEAMPEYQKQCENCTDIWMLCPSEDTGGWDGGDAMRLGSMMMLEKINKQQWLLPGYELRCEWYNDNCAGYTGQRIVSAKLDENPEKYVAIGTSGCSGVCGHIARYTQHYNMPMMSWAAGMPDLTDRTLFRNFFRTRIPHTAFTYAWLQMARICAWKNIVLIMAEEARFRGHNDLMEDTIAAEPDMSVVFRAQILSPLVQTDAVVQTIKDNRYRIIQMITYETTWRAMMCSANYLGASGLVWMVYGFYTKGFYGTLDNPDLSQWSCDKAMLRQMSNNAVFATSFMWASDTEKAIDCDKDKSLTTAAFIEEYWERAAELSTDTTLALGGRDYNTSRGGARPRDAGAQAADGACLYAMALSKLLGFEPDGLAATLAYSSNNTYSLSQLQERSAEAYEDMNQLLQSASFYGVSNSPFEFQCDNLPADRICDEACRNSKGCTGDAKGETIVFQFDSSGTEGDSDGASDTSEFPTIAEGRVESYTWRKALRFDYGGYWGGDSSSTPSDIPYYQLDCVEGYHKVNGTEFCVPDDTLPDCQAKGMVLAASGFCDVCPAGTMYSVVGEGASAQAVCAACPAGEVQSQAGQAACTKCPKGSVPGDASISCVACAPGTYADSVGMSACIACARGQYAASNGTIECSRCEIGTYQNETGQSGCTQCGAGLVTMKKLVLMGTEEWAYNDASEDVSDCGCDKGTQLHNGQCLSCDEGLDCTGMGEYLIEEGYAWDGGVSTYKCKGKVCPGGLAGECAAGRDTTSIGCSLCMEGKVAQGDGSCQDCGGADYMPIIVICLILVGMLLTAYVVIDRSEKAQQTGGIVLIGLVFSQFITLLQQFGVVALISVDWEHPLKAILGAFQLFTFNYEVINFGCVANADSLTFYVMRMVSVAMVFVAILVVHVVLVTVMQKGKFRERLPTLVCVAGTFMLAFNVPVVATISAPFMCDSHPNGKHTLQTYPDTLCWAGGKHDAIVVVGVVSVLFPVCYLAACAWALYVFPQKVLQGDVRFLKATYFLHCRFRPEARLYCIVMLVCNMLFAFSPVFGNQIHQLTVLQCIAIATLAIVVYWRPWRISLASDFDIMGRLGLVGFLHLASTLCRGTESDFKFISDVSLFVISLIFCSIPVAMSAGFYMRFVREKPFQFFLCYHKACAGAFARLLKIHLKLTPGVKQQVFLDVDQPIGLDERFTCINSDTSAMVLLGSSEVWSRPLCMAELAMAHTNAIRTVPVVFPGVALPDPEFIDHYTNHVPSITSLSAYGISVAMVQEALTQLRKDDAAIRLAEQPTESLMRRLCDKLVTNQSPGDGKIEELGGSRTEGDVAILADPTSSEALATALVLVQMLKQRAKLQGMSSQPFLLRSGDQPSTTAKVVLVVCTTGVFVQPHVVSGLLALSEDKRMVPIIADENFCMPTAQWAKDQRPLIESFCNRTDQAMDTVMSLFKQTPFVFDAATSGEALLETKVMDLAARLGVARADGPLDKVPELDSSNDESNVEVQVGAPAEPDAVEVPAVADPAPEQTPREEV